MALAEVIMYEGDNNTLIWKSQHTDFNTLSQLIVHESQEAIFFRDGEMLDSFGPGKYTLSTQNIPIIKRVFNMPTGGVTPFHCDIYFINKSLALNKKWGTSSPARAYDNTFNLFLTLGANGAMGLRVLDPRKLMVRLVGTETSLFAEQCLNYFTENITARVKEYLAKVMKKPEVNFMILDTCLSDFADAVKGLLNEEFTDIGVEIYNFIISNIHIPDDQYMEIVEGQKSLQRAAYEKRVKIIEAEGRAEGRKIEGYNWADEQVAQIAKAYAGNEGAQSSAAGMLAQAPMALAFGNMLRTNIEPILNPGFSTSPMNFGGNTSAPTDMGISGVGTAFTADAPDDVVPILGVNTQDQSKQKFCASCSAILTPNAKFCFECGAKVSADTICPKCGRHFAVNEKFCPECGAKKE